MQSETVHHVKVTTADPSALGLFGLAMVTLVASSQKLGITHDLALVVPWAIFLGGFAQLFACVQDAKHNNIFGTTAFGAFGLFWLAVGCSWLIQLGVFGEDLKILSDQSQLSIAFVGYLIFSVFMTIGALETNKVLFIIFVLIDFLFIGLSCSGLGIMPVLMQKVAAYSELGIALFSFYASAAVVLNVHLGRKVLPLGSAFGILKK